MNESRFFTDNVRLMGPERGAFMSGFPTGRPKRADHLQRYVHLLGPMPKSCLEAFVDLGLSDAEIGKYFRIPQDIVTQLREFWNISDIA